MLIQSLDYKLLQKFLENCETLIVINGISDAAIFFAETFVDRKGNLDTVIFNPHRTLRQERSASIILDSGTNLWINIEGGTVPSQEHILWICYACSPEPEKVKTWLEVMLQAVKFLPFRDIILMFKTRGSANTR